MKSHGCFVSCKSYNAGGQTIKRIACFLLVALMLVAGSASAGEKDYAAMLEQQEAEGLLHLWDIPFGITIDEFMELAEEKTGIPFEAACPNDEGKPLWCSFSACKDEGNVHYFAGHAIERSSVYFYDFSIGDDNRILYDDTQKEALQEARVDWLFNDNEGVRQQSEKYIDILSNLVEKYGKYEKCMIGISDDYNNKEYPLVDENGYLNAANFMEVMKQEKPISGIFIWKNAVCLMLCGDRVKNLLSFRITDAIEAN